MNHRRRIATDAERKLFEEVLRGAKTLERRPSKSKPKPPPAVKSPSSGTGAMGRGPSGIDGRTAERLRKGTIEPDARVDLHGLTEEAAHRALTVFLRAALSRGARLTLVITGKGRKPFAPAEPFDLELDRRTRGVLKAMVPRWLQEPELVRFVADVRSAHRRHGGAGALYVYLRKENKRT
jgi:DNA-nicking Smr family endonuclease